MNKASIFSGIRDAFAVSHLYSTCRSCYYKTVRTQSLCLTQRLSDSAAASAADYRVQT